MTTSEINESVSLDKSSTSGNEPSIKDLKSLFRYSGMIDSLRDSAHSLLYTSDVTGTVADAMHKDYSALYEKVLSTLSAAEQEEAKEHTVAALTVPRRMADIYYAAAKLACWVNMVHQTETFLVQQHLQKAQLGAAMRQTMGFSSVSTSPDLSGGLPVAAAGDFSSGTGQYL